jgi:hypothetical protein
MNKSYSKIRHIQESNMKLESRRFNQLLESKMGNVRPLINEDEGGNSLKDGLIAICEKEKYNGLDGLKKVCEFCKSSNVSQQGNTGNLIKSVNDILSGVDNPLNVMGGGSVKEVADLLLRELNSAEEACALAKFYHNMKGIVGQAFGGDDEDFYEAIEDDSLGKMDTAHPANDVINAFASAARRGIK